MQRERESERVLNKENNVDNELLAGILSYLGERDGEGFVKLVLILRLVSRVEGLIYFLQHGFRDFSHYDDVKAGGHSPAMRMAT